MFVRAPRRRKNGKWQRYYSVVENRRLANGSVTQRQVLYLGASNASQEAAWRKTLAVFDGLPSRVEELALFPDDRPVPPDARERGANSACADEVASSEALRGLLAGVPRLGGVGALRTSGLRGWPAAGAACRGRRCCGFWRSR